MLVFSLSINMRDSEDHDATDQLVSQLAQIVPQNDIYVRYKMDISDQEDDKDKDTDKDKDNKTEMLINQVFNVLVCIVMFLSFFALSASMSSNINSQKKEVGVLRAMGMTKYRIRLLYFYEALILVISSSLLGMFIGCTIGWTMLL